MKYIKFEELLTLNDSDKILVNRMAINSVLGKINFQEKSPGNIEKQKILNLAISSMLKQERRRDNMLAFGALMTVEQIKKVFNDISLPNTTFQLPKIIPNYSNEKVIKGKKAIFLAGPYIRGKDILSWQEEGFTILKKLGFDGVVYISNVSSVENDLVQLSWKKEALKEASVIVSWIPVELKNTLFATNIEFEYLNNKVISQNDFSKSKYLDVIYGKESNNTLEQLMLKAIDLANKLYKVKQHTTSIEKLIDLSVSNPKAFYETIALNMTKEEQAYIIENLKNKSCMNCTNGNCRVEHDEKTGIDENNNPQGYKCLSWDNSEYIGRYKVLKRETL